MVRCPFHQASALEVNGPPNLNVLPTPLPKRRKRRQERLPQDYKRHLRRYKCWKKTEKRGETIRSGLTQNKFVDILFALNPCVFIKGRRSRIQSVHC